MIPSAHLAEYVSHVDSDVIAIHENGIGYTEQSAPAPLVACVDSAAFCSQMQSGCTLTISRYRCRLFAVLSHPNVHTCVRKRTTIPAINEFDLYLLRIKLRFDETRHTEQQSTYNDAHEKGSNHPINNCRSIYPLPEPSGPILSSPSASLSRLLSFGGDRAAGTLGDRSPRAWFHESHTTCREARSSGR